MLVHSVARCALVRIVCGLHSAYFAAPLVFARVVVKGVSFCNFIRHAQQLGRAIVSLDGLAFCQGFVSFTPYVHALVSEDIQAHEFLGSGPAGVAQVRHQGAAPWMLDADLTRSGIGMASCQHLGVEHRIEDRVAMNFGDMVVRQFGGCRG